MFNIEISAPAVAWFGAILASANTIAMGYNFWNDRPRLGFSFHKDMVMNGGASVGQKAYAVVQVSNRGRRPVTLTVALFKSRTKKTKGYVLGDSMARLNNHELTEGKACQYLLEQQDNMDLNDLDVFEISDATGRTWKAKVKF